MDTIDNKNFNRENDIKPETTESIKIVDIKNDQKPTHIETMKVD